jgi:hypothetical protein
MGVRGVDLLGREVTVGVRVDVGAAASAVNVIVGVISSMGWQARSTLLNRQKQNKRAYKLLFIMKPLQAGKRSLAEELGFKMPSNHSVLLIIPPS